MPPPAAVPAPANKASQAVAAPRHVVVIEPQDAARPKPFAGVPVPLTGQTLVGGVPVSSASPSAPVAALGENLMVQIAAVSRMEDAQTLADALKHDGFAAMVRTAPGDKLYHVQIGPFASWDAAKNMRAKLVGNGYNAFIRP